MRCLIDTGPRVPLDCIFEITNACNLRCIHCEENAGHAKKGELSTAEALALIDDLAAMGTSKVHLSGGEPLLRSDWELLAKRLKAKGIAVHLITNGLLFSKSVALRCASLGVDMAAVSIDGLMEVHDAIRKYPKGETGASPFRRAFEAAALAKSVGLAVMVITHINGWNLSQLDALHEILCLLSPDGWQLQLGVNRGRMRSAPKGYALLPDALPAIADFIARKQQNPFRIIAADNIGYFSEHEMKLRPYDGKHYPFFTGCTAGLRAVSISADGTVKGCPSMGPGLCEGNIRDRSFREIWEDAESFAYNRRWDVRKLEGFCRDCEFNRLCRAGCTSFAASCGSMFENAYCLYRIAQQTKPNREAP